MNGLISAQKFRLCILAFSFLATLLSIGKVSAAPHLTLDLDSGKVLSHHQAFHPWHPASLTKLMTAYVVFRAIENREVSPDDAVRFSKNATRQSPSKMGYPRGTTITVEDALKLLIIKSANDVAVAIAESVDGSVSAFSDRMNREAIRLGMKSSRFVNPHGLHNPRQVITARDLGILLRVLHRSYPQYASYFKAPAVLAQKRAKGGKIIERVYYSYNLLLERYRGADGFKTGFVCASGYNFAGAATRGGRRIASIILGRNSQGDRAIAAAKEIGEGFQLPVNAGTPLSELAPSANIPSSPRNMRAALCNAKARAKRYEPGAGLAVIKSPWLSARKKQAVTIRTRLGVRTSISRIPIPKRRPNYAPPSPIEGVLVSARKSITLPTFRPATALRGTVLN